MLLSVSHRSKNSRADNKAQPVDILNNSKMLQGESRTGVRQEQSWADNDLDSLNSVSQGRDPARTSKPSVPDLVALGKTAASYPHISQAAAYASSSSMVHALLAKIPGRTRRNSPTSSSRRSSAPANLTLHGRNRSLFLPRRSLSRCCPRTAQKKR